MNNRLRTFALLTCIASTTALGTGLALADETAPAPAQGQVEGHGFGHGHGEFRRHGFRKMMKELKLTDQQKVQAKALYKSNRQTMRPLFASLLSAKHQLNTLAASGTADESALRAQAATLATAETNLAVQKAQNTKKFLALLTPDQVAKYNALQAKREARFQKFLGRMNNPGETE